MNRSDYTRAERLLNNIIKAEPDDFLADTAQAMLVDLKVERTRARAYNNVKSLLKKGAKRAARTAWKRFADNYPDYDPDELAAQLATPPRRKPVEPPQERKPSTEKKPASPTPKKSAAQSPLQEREPSTAKKPQIVQTEDILPAPFARIEIPGASEGYSIAKYPLTNAQFAPFIKDSGYDRKAWWTEAGWEYRQKEKWTEPRYWKDTKWNGTEQPVVGISWYEAVAYCLWLSDQTGQKIMLPTEGQWQYAAQGDDGREYPWGNEWDCKRCNNSVKPCDSNSTTPVTHYEKKGDSPFRVVDMVGNVWEWCLTDYENKTNDVNSQAKSRVLRGGSWGDYGSDLFRVSYRSQLNPYVRNSGVGFRLALSL